MKHDKLSTDITIAAGQFLEEKDYWLKNFQGELAKSSFPYDYPVKSPTERQMEKFTCQLSGRLFDRLTALSNKSDPRLHIIFVTGLVMLLYRYTGNKDIIIGIPIDRQEQKGAFINTVLALRNRFDGSYSFKELLFQVRDTIDGALKNQNYPIERLLFDLGLPYLGGTDDFPLFDSAVLVENIQDKSYIDHVNPNLLFSFLRKDHSIESEIEYNSALYRKSTIEKIVTHLTNLLNAVLFNVDRRLDSIDLLSETEKQQLLFEFNRTGIEYPENETIYESFEEVVEKTAAAIALVYDNEQVTYKMLNEEANRLARVLRKRDVKPNQVVGLMVDVSCEMVTGILGVLKSGAAYLPLDPGFPAERIDYILKDCNANLLLAAPAFTGKINFAGEIIDLTDRSTPAEDCSNLEKSNCPDDLAYVIYTSGSTGNPKGVMLRHRNITNQLFGLKKLYPFDSTLNHVLLAPYTFDPSVQQIFLPLTTGSRLLLVADAVKNNPPEFFESIISNCVNIINTVPSFMNVLLDFCAGGFDLHFKYIILAGEVFSKDVYMKLKENFSIEKIINIYGPTEATINTTLYECLPDETEAVISIGKPLINYQVWIVDGDGNPVPTGVDGEICISGKGIAGGYLNNPELTAEKFVSVSQGVFLLILSKSVQKKQSFSPFGSDLKDPGPSWAVGAAHFLKNRPLDPQKTFEKFYVGHISPLTIHHSPFTTHLYRTGDSGKWRSDGNIEFSGRLDKQVKIRGLRIEPGEVENRLLNFGGVKEAVVLVRGEASMDKYLVAYYVADETISPSDLKEYLSGKVPDYMVPAHFKQIDKIPLTPHGKLNHKELPEIEAAPEGKYVGPRDEYEKKLVKIWAQVLEMDEQNIGIDYEFFDLGGHSLKATLLTSRIHKEFAVKVAIKDVFLKPTIRSLAGLIKEEKKDLLISITPVEEREYYELSPAQTRIYFVQQLSKNSVSYNISIAVTVEGELSLNGLEDTYRRLIARHESLRSSFVLVNDRPVQRVHKKVDFGIFYCESDETEANAVISNFQRPFMLHEAPLIRVGLIKTGWNKHILLMDMHHIISDGISMGIFVDEFIASYTGKQLRGARVYYKDYAYWQSIFRNKETIDRQKEYWLNEYSGEFPILNLPNDFEYYEFQGFAGDYTRFSLRKNELERLKSLCKNEDVTLYMLLMAVYYIFLSRLSGQEDIVVGTFASGRGHPDLDNVIGMFIDALAIRNFPTAGKSFVEFLQEVKRSVLDAFENQQLQYEELLELVRKEKDSRLISLFRAAFLLQNIAAPKTDIPGLKIKTYEYELKEVKFDLNLEAEEIAGELVFTLGYSTLLFKKETIERFIGYFTGIINSILENPAQLLAEIDVLSKDEKDRLLFEFNDTKTDYPKDKTIYESFADQVKKTPQHIAVIGMYDDAPGMAQLSYMELDRRAVRLASLLRTKGITPGDIVAVMPQRAPEMMTGIFGILRAGAAYLPIDTDYPEARIRLMLKDSGTAAMLTQGKYLTVFNDLCETVDLKDHAVYAGAPGHSEELKTADDLAYLMYTSGSTGEPKGVAITDRAVVNFIKGISAVIAFGEHDNVLSLTTICFDIFGLETILPLTKGTKVVIGSRELQLNPRAANDAMLRLHISILQVTPSRLAMQIENPGSSAALELLDYLLVGGEAFPASLLEKTREIRKGKIYNLYGPTETTIWSTMQDVTGKKPLNIGKPIANTQVYILNKEGSLQPVGLPGELFIAGDGVARGYLNSQESTGERFTKNSFTGEGWLYKTGDLARWLMHGDIEFLGRIENQIKIRGYRVELGEIESKLSKHDDIDEAVVIMRQEENGVKTLAAYLVASREFTVSELRDYLSGSLPDYMIPSYFMRVEKIPLTPNGKIDRKALDRLGAKLAVETDYVMPQDGIEKIIAAVWAEVLNLEKVSLYDNFFDAGGTSLSIIKVNSKINKILGKDIPIVEMFNNPTIDSFVKYLNEGEAYKPVSEKELNDDMNLLEKSAQELLEAENE